MLGLIKATAVTLFVAGAFALVGCQDQSASRNNGAVEPAPESFNRPAGVADNNGTGIESPQPGTAQHQVGTEARSANLGGGTVHDPNAGAVGGGN